MTAAVDDGGIAGIAVAALFVLIFGAVLAVYWKARRRHVPMKTVLADLTHSNGHRRAKPPASATAVSATTEETAEASVKVSPRVSMDREPQPSSPKASHEEVSQVEVLVSTLDSPAQPGAVGDQSRERGSATTPERGSSANGTADAKTDPRTTDPKNRSSSVVYSDTV